ncbi:hypothetical protein ACOMHN_015419 [Nucella lapillus]
MMSCWVHARCRQADSRPSAKLPSNQVHSQPIPHTRKIRSKPRLRQTGSVGVAETIRSAVIEVDVKLIPNTSTTDQSCTNTETAGFLAGGVHRRHRLPCRPRLHGDDAEHLHG